MKKIIMAVVMVFAFVGVVRACPQYTKVTNWEDSVHVEKVDFGTESEDNFILEDWGYPLEGKHVYYGDGLTEDFALVWGLGICTEATKHASVTLPDLPSKIKSINIRHLAGAANDSFKIYINDVEVNKYVYAGESGWIVTEFIVDIDYPQLDSTVVKLVVDAPAWTSCSSWGQVGIDYMEFTMNGYSKVE